MYKGTPDAQHISPWPRRSPITPPSRDSGPVTYSKSPSSLLCNFCQALVDGSYGLSGPARIRDNSRSYPHHQTYSSLKESAATGCGLCAQFIIGGAKLQLGAGKGSVKVDISDPGWTNSRRNLERPDHKTLELSVPYTSGDDGEDRQDEISRTPIHMEFVVGMILSLNPVTNCDFTHPQPSTLDALPQCKKWLDRCLQSHQICNSINTAMTPTRLVAIGGSSLHVYEVKDPSEQLRYATLSHCWGNKVFLKLLSSNLHKLRESIPHESLSKTFRDAIFIALYLGFEYIWIDSLCIIQDDLDDWSHESALMADVYGAAELNIAASSAEDGSIGCFFQRQHTWRTQLHIPEEKETLVFDCYSARLLNPSTPVLLSRSWVVQERYLSRRTLYFDQRQVFWDCEDVFGCETFPDGLPSFIRNGSLFTTPKQSFDLQSWPGIVNSYSLTQLTNDSDKLIAIGGLAKRIWAQTGEEYITGLWKNNLEVHLCWRAFGPRETGRRVTPYQAPTWSWASVNGHIEYAGNPDEDASPSFNPEFYIQVHDIDVQYRTANIFGQVTGARIRISCEYLIFGYFQAKNPRHQWFRSLVSLQLLAGGTKMKLDAQFDCAEEHKDRIIKNMVPVGTQRVHEDDYPAIGLYVMPVRTRYKHSGPQCLLLEAVGGKKGNYRRIGICQLRWVENPKDPTGWWTEDNIRQLTGLEPKDSDCAAMVTDELGRTHCLIDII